MTRRARAVAVAVQRATRAAGVPPAARLTRWALAALARKTRGELTVRVVGRGESAALNARYRGKRGPTTNNDGCGNVVRISEPNALSKT